MRTRVHALSPANLPASASSVLLGMVALMAVAAVPGTAQAQAEYGMGEPFAYVGVSALAAFDDRDDLWLWNWNDANVDPGVTARAGIRIADAAAVEVQGDWVNLKSWRDNDTWTMTFNFRIYPTLYEPIGLKDFFPDRLQPYVVAGAGTMGATGDNGDDYQLKGAFRVGAGTDFYVTEQVAVSFGYEWITGVSSLSNIDTRNLTLGLQYNF